VTPRLTPSQTVGPFLAIGLPWPDGPFVVPDGSPGAITITGTVFDGAGEPLPDALVETWQADPRGRFAHPDDPRGTTEPGATGTGGTGTGGFRGFGRCATDGAGGYRIVTLRPGALPCPDGRTEAPHLDVSVFARGLLDRVVTRIYFPDEARANAADPVLASITDTRRRATLIAATLIADGGPAGASERASAFRFDIWLQGEHETVFFDV
jgi:protocatechuate 3,4-dioxygenase alpha subunit